MARRYEQPPLIEALCEFVYEPDKEWDLTIPGLLYEKIKSEFPDKEQQMMVGVEFQIANGNLSQARPAPSLPKMIFRSSDKASLVQVGAELFAVNKLPIYSGWPIFRESVIKNAKIYREITPSKKLKALTLRYINRVKVPTTSFDLDDYFNLVPKIPLGLSGPIVSFFVSTRLASGSPKGVLTIIAAAENPGNESSFIFDFQFTSVGEDCPKTEAFEAWLDGAHAKISAGFDGTFSEKCHKDLFKEKHL